MDAVLKVVPATNEPDALGRPAEEGSPKPTAPVADDEAGKALTPEEEAKLDEEIPADASATTSKKINKLLRQRRELRDQVSQMLPDANIGNRLGYFAKENDLSPDDIVMGMNAMAAVRRQDWRAFYTQVAPFVRKAQEVLGLVLPDDLGQRVQQGAMSDAQAREYAQMRFRQQQAEEAANVNAQRADHQRLQFVQTDVQRAVSAYEERLAASDPDYRTKADAIRRTAQALLLERGGKIGSVQEALEVVQRSYQEVTGQYRKFMPQGRATSPTPNGYSQQPSARAAPKNLMEAALAGLESSRR